MVTPHHWISIRFVFCHIAYTILSPLQYGSENFRKVVILTIVSVNPHHRSVHLNSDEGRQKQPHLKTLPFIIHSKKVCVF